MPIPCSSRPGPRRAKRRQVQEEPFCSCLRLTVLRGGARERLERPQLVPGRLVVDLGNIQTHAALFHLENALADSNVDRTALRACRSTFAPVAQVTFGEVVLHGVVRNARLLPEAQLVG